jgi:hypothetical protein
MSEEECPMCKLRQELITTQIRLTMAYAREGNKNFDKELEEAALKIRGEIIEKNKHIESLEKRILELEKEK